jgi:hypothetical protein
VLDRLKPSTLAALLRIAKHPTKGVLPFFRNPKAMIALREAARRKEN